MSISYQIVQDSREINNIRKKVSKYSCAYDAVRSLANGSIAKIQFDNLDLLRGFQSQINSNLKYRGRYATRSEELVLYVWQRF
jgi:hypothetical protein